MDQKIINILELIPKEITKWTCKDFKIFFEEIDVSTKVSNILYNYSIDGSNFFEMSKKDFEEIISSKYIENLLNWQKKINKYSKDFKQKELDSQANFRKISSTKEENKEKKEKKGKKENKEKKISSDSSDSEKKKPLKTEKKTNENNFSNVISRDSKTNKEKFKKPIIQAESIYIDETPEIKKSDKKPTNKWEIENEIIYSSEEFYCERPLPVNKKIEKKEESKQTDYKSKRTKKLNKIKIEEINSYDS